MREPLLFLAPLGAAAALGYAYQNAIWLKKRNTGDLAMMRAGEAVGGGARAYLTRLYTTAAGAFAVIFVLLVVLERQGLVGRFTPGAFLSGGIFSGLASCLALRVSTRAGLCTAAAARNSLTGALRVAVTGGAVTGLAAVGLGLAHLTGWYLILDRYYAPLDAAVRLSGIGSALVSSCLGSSLLALFIRVGGGIYAKVANLGADQARGWGNTAGLAEKVGRNVGHVPGTEADLFVSYAGALAAAASLSVPAGMGEAGFLLPFALAALGVVAGILGLGVVRGVEEASGLGLNKVLRRGKYLCTSIVAVAAYPLVVALLGTDGLRLYGAIVTGLVAGIFLGLDGEYYISAACPAAQDVVREAETGPAGVVIQGLAAGMRSTLVPVTVVGAAFLLSYYLGAGGGSSAMGLYGTGLAAAGILSTLGLNLAAQACGTVADNAAGIAEMSGSGEEVRRRVETLEGLGDWTAAAGKGYALGSSVLTTLAMIASLSERVRQMMPLSPEGTLHVQIDLNLMNPPVLVGTFLGGVLTFVFSAVSIQAMGRAASTVTGQLQGAGRSISADAGGVQLCCADLCARASLREMMLPVSIALLAPIGAGLVLGIHGLFGFLTGTMVTGFVLAVMMLNAGGVWDNAGKNIEVGVMGGRESGFYQAAMAGRTVGGVLQETAGPTLGIVMKLAAMAGLVLASVVMQYALIR